MDSFSKTDPWNMERAQVGFYSDASLFVKKISGLIFERIPQNYRPILRESFRIFYTCNIDFEELVVLVNILG